MWAQQDIGTIDIKQMHVILSFLLFDFKKYWVLGFNVILGLVGHAYHVVKEHGIPESNIVLMMYDDAANSTSNPYPGKLFNRPTGVKTKPVDVYAGCKVDYRGKEVEYEQSISPYCLLLN